MCDRCDSLIKALLEKLSYESSVWQMWGEKDENKTRGQASLERAKWLKNLKQRIESDSPLTIEDISNATKKWC